MRPPRISIASLCVLVALVALDLAWSRRTYFGGRSTFGFGDAPAFDIGVIPMANLLAVVLYLTLARSVRAGPGLVGFLIGGLAAVVAFLLWGWTWPDGVRLWLRPIYVARERWFAKFPLHEYIYLADAVLFLPAQLLIAAAGALIGRLLARRAGASGPAGDASPPPDGGV